MRLSTSLLTLTLGWLTATSAVAGTAPLALRGTNNPVTTRPAQTAPTLACYPNPARGQATLLLTAPRGPEVADYKLRLSNVLGREMRLLALRSDGTEQTLDLAGLPAGLYFCSLLQNDRVVHTSRLTVQ